MKSELGGTGRIKSKIKIRIKMEFPPGWFLAAIRATGATTRVNIGHVCDRDQNCLALQPLHSEGCSEDCVGRAGAIGNNEGISVRGEINSCKGAAKLERGKEGVGLELVTEHIRCSRDGKNVFWRVIPYLSDLLRE